MSNLIEKLTALLPRLSPLGREKHDDGDFRKHYPQYMQHFHNHYKRFTLSTFAAFGVLTTAVLTPLVAAPAAQAQANVVFSGGSGTPLTFSLSSPVTYTITTSSVLAPFFVFDAVGGPALNSLDLTGSITYSVNGGAAKTIRTLSNGANASAVTPDDTILFGDATIVLAGDTVVLGSGALTSTSNFAGAVPTSGSFATFIANSAGNQISGNGTPISSAAPEPNSLALLLPALGGVGMVIRKRRKK